MRFVFYLQGLTCLLSHGSNLVGIRTFPKPVNIQLKAKLCMNPFYLDISISLTISFTPFLIVIVRNISLLFNSCCNHPWYPNQLDLLAKPDFLPSLSSKWRPFKRSKIPTTIITTTSTQIAILVKQHHHHHLCLQSKG